MRDRITTALEVAGLASISLGAFLASPVLGFVVVGVSLLLLGVLGARPAGGSE